MTTTRLFPFTAIENDFVQKHYRRDAYRYKKGYVVAPLVFLFISLSAHAYLVTLPSKAAVASPPAVKEVSAAPAVITTNKTNTHKRVATTATQTPAQQPLPKPTAVTPPKEKKTATQHQENVTPTPSPHTQVASAAVAAPALLKTPTATEIRQVEDVVCRIPQPRYPVRARQRQEEGTVILQAVISSQGRIQNARVFSKFYSITHHDRTESSAFGRDTRTFRTLSRR